LTGVRRICKNGEDVEIIGILRIRLNVQEKVRRVGNVRQKQSGLAVGVAFGKENEIDAVGRRRRWLKWCKIFAPMTANCSINPPAKPEAGKSAGQFDLFSSWRDQTVKTRLALAGVIVAT